MRCGWKLQTSNLISGACLLVVQLWVKASSCLLHFFTEKERLPPWTCCSNVNEMKGLRSLVSVDLDGTGTTSGNKLETATSTQTSSGLNEAELHTSDHLRFQLWGFLTVPEGNLRGVKVPDDGGLLQRRTRVFFYVAPASVMSLLFSFRPPDVLRRLLSLLPCSLFSSELNVMLKVRSSACLLSIYRSRHFCF